MNDFSDTTRPPSPAYLRLYRQLKTEILRGAFPYGSRFPSKRVTAAENGVSIITAEHAYALLCEEGYLEARQRSGYFVLFRSSDGFAASPPPPAAAAVSAPSVAGNGTNADENGSETAFPFSVLAQTMRRVLTRYGKTILEKSPNAGMPPLRDALCRYLARNRGIFTDRRRLIIGSGAEYLYSLIALMLGERRLFAIESPSYEKIEQVYRNAGVRCDLLPLGHDGIDSRALAATAAEVLHLTPYRSFPSGVTASASKRYEYLNWVSRGSRLIIEDDFESEFALTPKREETLFALCPDARILYLNTFSKTVSPALRIGYMVLPEPLLPLFEQKAGFYSCTVPTFEQLVLAELLESGDFERHINRVRRAKRRENAGR